MADAEKPIDYIVVGGGLSGCVIASRIHQARPDLSVTLLEAGPDESRNEKVLMPAAARSLGDTPLLSKYKTTPQAHLNNRQVEFYGGRLLGGSSASNYGAWTRGHEDDYNLWAELVNDKRWSYGELLPYFKRSEHYHGTASDDQHGYEGPIHTSSGGRNYPLREVMRKIYEVSGIVSNPDMNTGNPVGIAPLVESWYQGNRQHAANCYPLQGVSVLTNTPATRIVISRDNDGIRRAIGVTIPSGKVLLAKNEVIICCGALKTPQLLMLSGIGPSSELVKHGIEQEMDLPVGLNLHDHPTTPVAFQLRYPERGLAVGSPEFMNKPNHFTGNPMDWFITAAISGDELEQAANTDSLFAGKKPVDFEITCLYTGSQYGAPDGSHITLGVVCLSTTARGTVTLQSNRPEDSPIIDPQYLSTEHDRIIMRSGVRFILQMMSSKAAEEHFTGEAPPQGFPQLTPVSPDAVIDSHVRSSTTCGQHPAGSASMGTVVDSECRVKGIGGLRVVDASIVPASISAHMQAPMYGIAERAAEMILHAAEMILHAA
ncbi:MAG: hypothetical protein M1820_002786 [Bogoriella megaspora]|nr:MAG: hypothetical protein M1820_002786 [Bogoriella megaspora]